MPAPDALLKVVCCNSSASGRNPCKSNVCSCYKNGLKCVAVCGNCRGVNCWDTMEEDDDDVEMDGNDHVDDGNAFNRLFNV